MPYRYDSRDAVGSVSNIIIHALFSSLQSDNVFTYAGVSLATPFLLRVLFKAADDIYPVLCKGANDLIFCSNTKELDLNNEMSGAESDRRNDLLFKAVVLYLNKLHAESLTPLRDGKTQFVAADDSALELRMKEMNDRNAMIPGMRAAGMGVAAPTSKHSFLQKFEITSIPTENTWVKIMPGLYYMLCSKSVAPNKAMVRKHRNLMAGGMGDMYGMPPVAAGEEEQTACVRSIKFLSSDWRYTSLVSLGSAFYKFFTPWEARKPDPIAPLRIDVFLQEALDWHIKKLEVMKDDLTRYYYVARLAKKSDAASMSAGRAALGLSGMGAFGGAVGGRPGARVGPQFVRYALSNNKKFSNLFLPEKESLLELVDNFIHKRDKFAIDGFPHKLGLLLCGPPGTGKTSLIKALAQYTGRHVVSIKLEQIGSNQELMDLVFSQLYNVEDLDFPVSLTFKDVIFVFEDIDAASEVVLTRTRGKVAHGLEGEDEAEESRARPVHATFSRQSSSNDDYKSEIELAPGFSVKTTSTEVMRKKEKDKDALNLSGLLNVLDGIVDTPNRIIVMTTNHPKRLDKALIRPGRIDKYLYLGTMRAKEASQLVKHYFSDEAISDDHYARLVTLLGSEKQQQGTLKERGTPAFIEQRCAEARTVDELLASLEASEGEVEEAFAEEFSDVNNGTELSACPTHASPTLTNVSPSSVNPATSPMFPASAFGFGSPLTAPGK